MGEPRITAEIPFPHDSQTGGVAVGDGSAWVGLLEQGKPDSVLRIDLATNEVVAKIPVTSVPWRKHIVVTNDAVWVASYGLIERIDPATNAVIARVELRGREISALAADATALWAVTYDDSGKCILVRINPSTNGIVAEIRLEAQLTGYQDEVLIGDGAVWILGIRWIPREDTEYGSDLIRVDSATNAIVEPIPVGGFNMVMAADAVWVRFPADGAFDGTESGEPELWLWTRVDVVTNEVSKPFAFEDSGLALVTPDSLWSVGYDEHDYVRVTRFDPNTLAVEARSEPVKSYYHDAVVDPASGTVWVSAVWNLVRFDIR